MATPVILPRLGQSVESCIITELLVKKGDKVKVGDVLFRYETDKAAFDLEADQDGTVIDILYNEGDEVVVLDTVLVLGEEGGPSKVEVRRSKVEDRRSKVDVRRPKEGRRSMFEDRIKKEEGNSKISPRAKVLAKKLGIPTGQISGSGPGGRVIERDIEHYIKEGGRMTAQAMTKATETGYIAPQRGSGIGGRILDTDLIPAGSASADDSTISKLSNIRKIIADKMHASLQNSAQLTHHMSADARVMLSIRQEVKKKVEKGESGNITLNDLVCYSVIRALKKMPDINSHFLGDSIQTFNKVHLGIAVDTERGLMVPALRNADDLSIAQLSAELKKLADSCKSGNIDPDLLAPAAASFTVSNLGAFGVEMFTPVINLPQSGIMGVNTIIRRPGDVGGGIIGFIPYIGLSLTYDHRAIDGAPASAFLREVKEQIENLNVNL